MTVIKNEERRRGERLDVLRPIVYVYHNSDRFIEATMLNHCSIGICFQSTLPVSPGSKIYIMTEEYLFESDCFRSGEAYFAEVMWCSRRAGAHRVGVQFIKNSIGEGGEGLGLSTSGG